MEWPGDSPPPRKRARVGRYEWRCDACTRLFSQQALQDLNSSSGFVHKTRKGIWFPNHCDLCRFILDVGLNEFGAHLWKDDGLLRFWNLKLNPGDESSYINALVGRVNGINGHILLYPFVKEGLGSVLF
jgi:hypothetical protein